MEIETSIRSAKRSLILASVILCVTGLVFMIFSDVMVKMIGWILGAILCIIGIIQVVAYIRRSQLITELIFGILGIVLGVLIFAHPAWVMSILSVIIGLYILVEGALKVKIAFDAKKQDAKGWWVLFVAAVISIVISIILIINPFGMSKAFMFVLGLALLLNGIENIIHAVYTEKILKEMNTEIIDMDEYVEQNKDR